MTIRELQKIVNSVNEKYLDTEVKFCYEDDTGYGTVCEGAWFDVQYFWYGGGNICTVTLCEGEIALRSHCGRVPWSEFEGQWIKDEED